MRYLVGIAVLGILLGGSTARADPAAPPAGTIIASMSDSDTDVSLSATVMSWVIDPDNVTLGLVFAWQVIMAGTSSADDTTAGDSFQWAPWTLVTDWVAVTFDGEHLTGSLTSNQNPSAHGVASPDGHPFYNFLSGGSSTLNPGDESAILWVQTNAPSYTAGVFNVQNGRNITVDSFAPVPEPASLLLLGTGLLAFGGIARRRIQKRKNAQS